LAVIRAFYLAQESRLRKILIFGNSASGKSTLAKKISETQALAHLDLDILAWQETVPPVRKPLTESSELIQAFIQSSDGWVIEGCYSDLLELALPCANEIIFMNIPIPICISNAKHRPWEPHKYHSKEAQDSNLDMLINWISQYETREDTFSKKAHIALYQSFDGKKSQCVRNEKTPNMLRA
jgi:adenylate kinase family enzyme